LVVRDAARAIEFYKKAFGATEVSILEMPGGKIGHAELTIGDSKIMLAGEFPGGAKADMPPTDMFWGDRYGVLTDPFGHSWGLATHIKDVTAEEMQKGAEAAFAKMRTPHA
jgi:PhnB protein